MNHDRTTRPEVEPSDGSLKAFVAAFFDDIESGALETSALDDYAARLNALAADLSSTLTANPSTTPDDTP